MCLSTVYKNTMTPDAVVLRNVMKIENKDGVIVLTDLMERQVAIEGTLELANLVEGYVLEKENCFQAERRRRSALSFQKSTSLRGGPKADVAISCHRSAIFDAVHASLGTTEAAWSCFLQKSKFSPYPGENRFFM